MFMFFFCKLTSVKKRADMGPETHFFYLHNNMYCLEGLPHMCPGFLEMTNTTDNRGFLNLAKMNTKIIKEISLPGKFVSTPCLYKTL